MISKKQFLHHLMIAATLCVVPLHAISQSNRTVSIIIPQPAGAPNDVYARKLQPIIQKELGMTVVVENLPGAGGSIGVNKMLNAPNDGFSIVQVSQTEPILTPLTVAVARYAPEQMRMIGLLGHTSYVLIGRPELPAQSHADLVDLLKKSADRPLSYGHIGPGSMIHLLGEQWARQIGGKVNHIVYRGVPPVLQDVMSGQIDLAFLPLGGATLQAIESGRVKAFGLSSAKADARMPKVQTLTSQDSKLRNFVYGAWGAWLVPKGVPESMQTRLNNAFNVAMRDTEVQAFLHANGLTPQAPLSFDELDRFYGKEIVSQQTLARSIGVKPE